MHFALVRGTRTKFQNNDKLFHDFIDIHFLASLRKEQFLLLGHQSSRRPRQL